MSSPERVGDPLERRCERCGAILARDNPADQCSNHTAGERLDREDHLDPTLAEVIDLCGEWPERSTGDRARVVDHAASLGIRLADSQAARMLERYEDPFAALDDMRTLARWLDVDLGEPAACHRYVNGCKCTRCSDRADRVAALKQANQLPQAEIAGTAKRDSARHFGEAE